MNSQLAIKKILFGCLAFSLGMNAFAETKTYEFSNFNQLQLSGNYQVNFTQAKNYSIKLTSDEINNVDVIKLNREILINSKNSLSANNQAFQLTITAPSLAAVHLLGNYKGKFSFTKIDQFNINTQGRGSLVLAGNIRQLSLDSQAALFIDAKKACADEINLRSAGVINASFCANKNAKFNRETAGVTNITVYGSPVFGQSLGFGPDNIRVERQ